MKGIDQWEVMGKYEVVYKHNSIEVELVRIQTTGPPQHYFFVYLPEREMLLGKKLLQSSDKTLWIGPGMNFEESKELGETIEAQTKFILPLPDTNNPFEYEGDLAIHTQVFFIGNIKIEKAKAPFSEDIYYKLYLRSCLKMIF